MEILAVMKEMIFSNQGLCLIRKERIGKGRGEKASHEEEKSSHERAPRAHRPPFPGHTQESS